MAAAEQLPKRGCRASFAVAQLQTHYTWTTTNGLVGDFDLNRGPIAGLPDAIAADINSDGIPDLIFLQQGVPPTHGQQDDVTGIQVFLGGAAFPAQPQFITSLDDFELNNSTPKGPVQVVAADVNGDGLMDLVVANFNSEELEIVQNTSTFSLTAVPVEVTGTADVTKVNFTNVSLGSLGGMVTDDVNRNGAVEPADVGRAGVQVYVDLNHNGQHDAGEALTSTNSAGLFSFNNLPSGAYDVRLVDEPGWLITTPGDGSGQAVVGNGQGASFLQFSTAPRLFATISNQAISEEQLVTLTAQLSSAAAGRHMTFQLVNAPAGATIDSGSGEFSWTPTVGQAPRTWTIAVRAFDLLDPSFSEDISFQVQVNAVPTNEHFVFALYQSMLQRAPEAAGLNSWTAEPNAGSSRSLITAVFWASQEHRGLEVDSYYENYLHRAADAAGRQSWVAALTATSDEFAVQLAFLSSAEYRAQWSSDQAFVAGVYQDVLDRPADAAGLAFWQNIAGTSGGQAKVAAGLLGSTEHYLTKTGDLYNSLLERAASTQDLAFWLAQMEQQKATLSGGEQFILASDEFFLRT